MMEQPAAMHVVRIKSRHTDKQGRERQYESRLLRRTCRGGGTVRNETLANLSKLPDRTVDPVEAALKGEALVPAGEAAARIARSLPPGHVATAYAMARKLGLPGLLGPAGRQRDLALASARRRPADRGTGLLAVTVGGVAVLAAACSRARRSSGPTSARSAGLAYAGCVRSRGFEDSPGPPASGAARVIRASGIGPDSLRFSLAERNCQAGTAVTVRVAMADAMPR